MDFADGTVHSIRSISQRGLGAAWARLAKDGLPSFDRFDPGPRVHDPKQLAVWKVEAADGQNLFRALYRGSLLDQAFEDGWTGRTLAEVTPPSLHTAIIGASERCAGSACAVYTILRTCDGAGFALDLERLLLPFGEDGRVRLILASLQLISLEGTVERRSAVTNFEARSEIVLSMVIPAAGFVSRRVANRNALATGAA